MTITEFHAGTLVGIGLATLAAVAVWAFATAPKEE